MSATEFEIVVLCTGNRFRSPLAEALLRRATEGLPVKIRSLGTLDLGSVGALPEAVTEGTRLGLDLARHRTQVLARQALSDADLVLGFERAHVAQAVVVGGASLERTFTLPELVQLLNEVLPSSNDAGVVERARASVAAAARARTADPRTSALSEIADPLGRAPSFYTETAAQVREVTEQLVPRLFG